MWVSRDRAKPRLRHTGTTCTPLAAEAQGVQYTAVQYSPRHGRGAQAWFTHRIALKAFPMGVQGLAVPEGDMPPRSEIMSFWTAQPVKQCMPI